MLTVIVDTPFERVVDSWSWWDYTSLIAVLMVPVALMINLVWTRRRRKRLEAQGISLEELELRESIQLDEPVDYLEEEVD
jgi:integral membrane sensor domain MASE1